ncbi:DUF2065 family protein [Pseudotabrizicola sp. L79]|uniref:DUF2065 family protein n=1 Tax=Pseudotabrizicola sp. L79 TaxID=3118402 RepID=UPI002F927396
MTTLILAIGLVLVIEGLALALAPSRIETVLAMFAALTIDQRRRLGLIAVALGVAVVAIAKTLAA